MRLFLTALVSLLAVTVMASSGSVSAQAVATYHVRLINLTTGQPFSPPVAATHRGDLHLFRVGRTASAEVEAIAEDGNQIPMVTLLGGLSRVTQVVDVARPLTPLGKTVGAFTPIVTFEITGRPGDKFSLLTMLICTNDGILGLDSVELPEKGRQIYVANGYDAGTEDNTEVSQDIVDPCTGLGPTALPGDPDGNDDAGVNTSPRQVIRHHPGIAGVGELSPATHGWLDPVALVIIERI